MQKTRTEQQTIRSSEFWRETKTAVRSGKYEKFWELSKHEQAWLIAAFETEDAIQQIVDWVADQEAAGKK